MDRKMPARGTGKKRKTSSIAGSLATAAGAHVPCPRHEVAEQIHGKSRADLGKITILNG